MPIVVDALLITNAQCTRTRKRPHGFDPCAGLDAVGHPLLHPAFLSPSNDISVFHQDFVVGNIVYAVTDYPALRAFYAKFETKDQESAVLKAAAPSASGN